MHAGCFQIYMTILKVSYMQVNSLICIQDALRDLCIKNWKMIWKTVLFLST